MATCCIDGKISNNMTPVVMVVSVVIVIVALKTLLKGSLVAGMTYLIPSAAIAVWSIKQMAADGVPTNFTSIFSKIFGNTKKPPTTPPLEEEEGEEAPESPANRSFTNQVKDALLKLGVLSP